MNKWLKSSFVRFLLVGAGNTIISLLIMFLLEGFGYWTSTSIAYIIGATVSFFLNRIYTFYSKEKLLRSAVKFSVNGVVCYIIG